MIPGALSRMAGQSEGEPTDTDRFMVAEIEDILFTADHADSAETMLTQHDSRLASTDHADSAETTQIQNDSYFTSMTESDEHDPPLASTNDAPSDDTGSNHNDDPETNHMNCNSPYYCRIQKYLEKRTKLDDTNEKFKDQCEKYELHDRILHNARTGRRVILDLEFMKETLEFAHKDMSHYGKRATSKAVAQRFEVAKDLWMEGRKVLDRCIPCQLFKATSDETDTAMIHPYSEKDLLNSGRSISLAHGSRPPLAIATLLWPLTTAQPKRSVYPLPACST